MVNKFSKKKISCLEDGVSSLINSIKLEASDELYVLGFIKIASLDLFLA